MLPILAESMIGLSSEAIVDDVNELYRRTKIAQRQAERRGFTGTAAALASIAELLAQQASVDLALVQQFADRVAVSPQGVL